MKHLTKTGQNLKMRVTKIGQKLKTRVTDQMNK